MKKITKREAARLVWVTGRPATGYQIFFAIEPGPHHEFATLRHGLFTSYRAARVVCAAIRSDLVNRK